MILAGVNAGAIRIVSMKRKSPVPAVKYSSDDGESRENCGLRARSGRQRRRRARRRHAPIHRTRPSPRRADGRADRYLFSRRNAVRAPNRTRTVHDRRPRQTPSRITGATDRARAVGVAGLPRSPGDAVSVERAGRALRVRARRARPRSVRRSRDRVSKLSSKSL